MTDSEVHSVDRSVASATPWWRRHLSSRQAMVGLVLGFSIVLLAASVAYHALLPVPGSVARGQSSGDSSRLFPTYFSTEADTFSLIPKDEIYSGGPPKDGIPALTNPRVVAADASGLRSDDRVIGVVFGGEARAYPLRILNWHEIVNDALGDRSIAVTYCPLCDSAVVFDRHVGGQEREFGVSGLLYNSNVLMHDRQEDESQESLWSQMMLRAVVGPAAVLELSLDPLPAQLTTWEAWRREHPGTTSLSFETGHVRDYSANPYARYFAVDDLMFPVVAIGEPAADADSLPAKEPVIIVVVGERLKGYPVSRLKKALDSGESAIADRFAGLELRIKPVNADRGIYHVTDADGGPVPVAFSFWFEFRAMHPAEEVFDPPSR